MGRRLIVEEKKGKKPSWLSRPNQDQPQRGEPSQEKPQLQLPKLKIGEPKLSQINHLRIFLFIWGSLFYFEMLLMLGSKEPLSGLAVLYAALFSVPAAGIYFLLSTAFRRKKTNTWILAVLLILTAVFFGIEYFCKVFFTHYMSIGSIFSGIGGVVTSFFGVIVRLVVRGFWMVILLFLPVIILFLLRRFKLVSLKGSKGSRILALCLAVVVFLFARLLVRLNPVSEERYTSHFQFTTATNTFGLGTSSRLDVRYLIFGNPKASGFDYDEPDDKQDPDDGQEGGGGSGEDVTPPDDQPTPVVYGYNALDIDFAALAQSATDSTVADIHAYVASLTPSHKNEYTGLFAGKNLIFITAEAFSGEFVDPELTPTLYRLMTKGIRFTDYYQPIWGGSTSSGEFSNLTGLVPAYAVDSMLESIGKDMYYTPGNQLRRLGYFSRAYHAHTYDYYSRDLTHENMGYDKYVGYGNGLEDRITWQWPESDLELMQATVDEYIDHRPFSIYYMTVSAHGNYGPGTNIMSEKHWDEVEGLDASYGVKGYIACSLELEAAMTYLVDRLEAAGIADDTVIVLGTDHYPYALELEPSEKGYANALDEYYGYTWQNPWERDHSALIIWSGCLEDRDPIVVDTPVHSLDIAPTLANLMGFQFDSRLYAGRDALSDAPPLVFFVDYSWKTDKASYNMSRGELTVFPGHEDEVDDDYVAAMKRAVFNKFAFSKNVIDTDYYHVLLESVDTVLK